MGRAIPGGTAASLMLALAALAWTAPEIDNVCHSAPGGTVTVHADCADAAGAPLLPTAARLFYSTDGQGSWTEVAMTPVGAAGYDSTHQGTFTAPATGAASYYVRAGNGSNYSTQAPCNGANTWPVGANLLAETADEPAGDAVNPEGSWLDLTGIWFGYSGDRFYARITNDHNSWPVSGGILGPWYIYSVGFRNPEAPCDSYAFIMTYANALGIFTTGLYEANELTEELIRIGDIDVEISGNRLDMRCLISDLTERELFGPWPNSCGYLTSVTGNTQSADIQQRHYQRDTTAKCRFYPRTPGFTVGQNRSPLLTQPRVVPSSGTPETEFWFSVRYSDPDSNLPVTRSVVVDADTFELEPNHHRYWVGAVFDLTRSGFAPGWHRFHYLFSDGTAQVTSPSDSFRVEGVGVNEGEGRLGPGGRQLAVVPNPADGDFAVLSGRGFRGQGIGLRMYNSAGQVVLSRTFGIDSPSFELPLDLQGMPAGVFTIRLQGNGHEGSRTTFVHR